VPARVRECAKAEKTTHVALSASRPGARRSSRAGALRARLLVTLQRKALALDDLACHCCREESQRILRARDNGLFERVRGLASIQRDTRHVEMLLLVRTHARIPIAFGMFSPPADRRRSTIELGVALDARQYSRRDHGIDRHLDTTLPREVRPVIDVLVRRGHEQELIEREDRSGEWR